MAKGKKRKIVVWKLIVMIFSFLIILYGAFLIVKLVVNKTGQIIDLGATAYLSSNDEKIKIYNLDYQEEITLSRGTKIKLYDKDVEQKDENGNIIKTYKKIEYENKKYLIDGKYVTKEEKNIVTEKDVYVRTPATLYETSNDIKIKSHLIKGLKLEVLGYDKLNSDGSVNMYKVKSNDLEGYVYSKYVVQDENEANTYYDYNGTYSIHQNRGDRFGGGDASKLDYFPFEKPKFEDNVMPSEVRALYVNSNVLSNIDAYIKLAKENNINAFVVDIKEATVPGYPALAMKEYSMTNYNQASNSYENYKKVITKLKENGFYVIGRIVVFKDSLFVADNPDSAIASKTTKEPYKISNSYWPSVFSRIVWEFNVKLAIESVTEMGFNEIQFDYVRFPDRTGSFEHLLDMKNKYNESKAQAVQAFLMYASDEIHKAGAYVSADVFGESANTYVAAYGQYWSAISNIVDVISGMPYPDHFAKGEYGLAIPWTEPYKLLNAWGKTVMERQKEAPTPAVIRTWIQTYDAIREPYITYDSTKISEQIQALYDAGLTGGYMTWNGNSSYSKYASVASAFKKDYLK